MLLDTDLDVSDLLMTSYISRLIIWITVWVTIGSQLIIIGTTCALMVYYKFKNAAVREGRSPPIDGRPGFLHTF